MTYLKGISKSRAMNQTSGDFYTNKRQRKKPAVRTSCKTNMPPSTHLSSHPVITLSLIKHLKAETRIDSHATNQPTYSYSSM